MQYVSETVQQQLNKRFKWHKCGFRHPIKHGYCKILSNYFNNRLCKGTQYRFNIIEIISGPEQKNRGDMDASFTQMYKSIKIYWIKRLRTTFLVGDTVRVYDEIDDEIDDDDDDDDGDSYMMK